MNTVLDYVMMEDPAEEDLNNFIKEMISNAESNPVDDPFKYQYNKEAPFGLKSKNIGISYKFNKDPEYGKYSIYLIYDFNKKIFVIYREGFNVSDRNSMKYIYYWVNEDRNIKE